MMDKYKVDFLCSDLRHAETKERELRALHSATKSLGKYRKLKMTIITMDHRGIEQVSGTDIECLPAWEWLLRRD